MKKEITSFVIGAGIVGAFWAGTAFCKNESKNTTPVSEQKINEKQPNLLKKTLTDIYFATPNKNFPGLELTDTDFLVPFNRLQITEHFYFTSPNEFSGNCSWCCGASKKRSRTALFVYRQMVMA